MYIELRPNKLLYDYVDGYWMWEEVEETKIFQHVLASSCVDMIVSLGDSSLKNGFEQNVPYIFGVKTASFIPPDKGHIKMLGIRFKPAAFKLFTKIPASEFTDLKGVDIRSFKSMFDLSFYDMVGNAIADNLPVNAMIGIVERFLVDKLPLLPSGDERVRHAIALAQAHAGNLPVDQLAAESCLSERQLQRLFMEEVGIGPKTFSRIVKFREAHKRLNTDTRANLHELAWECGYYDNAHLTKEYLKLAGTLPSSI